MRCLGSLSIASLVSSALACTPGATVAEDPAGAFRFPLGEDARAEIEGDKVRWRLGEVTVAAQRVARTPLHHRRTLADVARALQERYDRGEVDGRILVPPCTLAGRAGHCVEGHLMDDERRIERRGWLVTDQGGFLLIELAADARHHEALEREKRRVESGFEWLTEGT
jgi:hypothetical protein